MNSKFNKKAYEKCKDSLDNETKELYDTFNDTVQRVSTEFTEEVDEDSIIYSTSNGSLNDEHNGYILNKARKSFKQLKDNAVIEDYTEEDISDDDEHRVKFKVK